MRKLSSCVRFQPPRKSPSTGWPATPAPAVPRRHARIYPMNHQLPTSSNHTNHMHIISYLHLYRRLCPPSSLHQSLVPSVPSYFHTTVSCLISSLHRCGRKIICLSRLGTGERSHPEFPGRTPASLDSTNGIKSTALMVMILRWSLWWYYRCFVCGKWFSET